MKELIKEKYKGQGFVEALIAILITGIAAIALMQISATTIKNVVDNEVYDQLTTEAVKGASMVRHAVGYLEIGESSAPGFGTLPAKTSYLNKCYPLDGDIENPVNPLQEVCTYSASGLDRETCADDEDAKIDFNGGEDFTDPNFFRVICYTSVSSSVGNLDVVVAKIFTGFRDCTEYQIDNNAYAEQHPGECPYYEHTLVFSHPHIGN